MIPKRVIEADSLKGACQRSCSADWPNSIHQNMSPSGLICLFDCAMKVFWSLMSNPCPCFPGSLLFFEAHLMLHFFKNPVTVECIKLPSPFLSHIENYTSSVTSSLYINILQQILFLNWFRKS